KANTKYYYKVRAYRTVNKKKVYSAYSDVVSEYPNPAKPGSLSGKSYNGETVRLSWAAVSYANGYKVYRKENDQWTEIGTTEACTYDDANLQFNTKYTYTVKAYRINEEKEYVSTSATPVTVKTALCVPKNVELEQTESCSVTLTFDRQPADGYQIRRKKGSSGTYSTIYKGELPVGVNAAGVVEVTYTDMTVKAGSTYYYSIRAYRTASDGTTYYSSWSGAKSMKVTAFAHKGYTYPHTYALEEGGTMKVTNVTFTVSEKTDDTVSGTMKVYYEKLVLPDTGNGLNFSVNFTDEEGNVQSVSLGLQGSGKVLRNGVISIPFESLARAQYYYSFDGE
ncbi:MAG: hypothetical protein HUJ58_03605, partial [Erysipelotrichaceae bacterium]|nr:hypothetical protein [Erysipelotrichaceae bacterium]